MVSTGDPPVPRVSVEGTRESVPETHFAPASRADENTLREMAEAISADPLASALMRISGEIVAILNAERQIVAVNDGLLRRIGAVSAVSLIGLRPGEALKCVHAEDHPGGCGTGPHCMDCGAVAAILLAQSSGHPVDRECQIHVNTGTPASLDLMVRAVPFRFMDGRLVALILHDVPA
ncbi:MAG: hypothetical protein DIJKHBIC_02630 [Thermoanaerobaculia bacterium]|nr:hypothetical protein [Thermoanaerobaculia bacterium]